MVPVADQMMLAKSNGGASQSQSQSHKSQSQGHQSQSQSQACAACKYQRRKCTPECPLAPYFPADQPKQFQNAHRLYGVSNILKILAKLDTVQKAEAMRSIIYESNIRARYPAHGCVGIISALQLQAHHAQQDLDRLNAAIALLRQQLQQQDQQQLVLLGNTGQQSGSNGHNNVDHHHGNVLALFSDGLIMGEQRNQMGQHQVFGGDTGLNIYPANNNVNSSTADGNADLFWVTHHQQPQQSYNGSNHSSALCGGDGTAATASEAVGHYADVSPYFDGAVDDRQESRVDSKENVFGSRFLSLDI